MTTTPTSIIESSNEDKTTKSLRKSFYFELNLTESTEINFKELVLKKNGNIKSSTTNIETTSFTKESSVDITSNDISIHSNNLNTSTQVSKNSRFNIIEHLEKRYGSGAVLDYSLSGVDKQDRGNYDRRDDDDLYDSEDSFIDDEELQQNIEEVYEQTKVKTKHSGFFVNAGDTIETTIQSSDEENPRPTKKIKSKKSKSVEISRANKSFLDEWAEAAADWQPNPEVLTAIDDLQQAVETLEANSPIGKVFPRILDNPLRTVDKLVVESHPNKWRVNGYFATIMAFLPFTKQYLKSNMLRLEARDVAREAKEAMETWESQLAKYILNIVEQLTEPSAELIKEEASKDKEFASKLKELCILQDNWVKKENEYRQMLKTEDKKLIPDKVDYLPLNARQERNRVFNRVISYFPTSAMDQQSIRAIHRSVKGKTHKKAGQSINSGKSKVESTTAAESTSNEFVVQVTKGNTPQNAKRKKPETTNSDSRTRPINNSKGGATSNNHPTNKRGPLHAFKSRILDDCPPFSENDFEEQNESGTQS